MKAPAELLDFKLWYIFENVCGFSVPRMNMGLGWECALTGEDVPLSVRGQSFHHSAFICKEVG